tara:strand:- start:259 stop:426 length:168 start_codon:yes stop_codon:yes gene_type:complete
MPGLEDMVQRIMTNDLPHIQARLSVLEIQGRITIALILIVLGAVISGAISVLVTR